MGTDEIIKSKITIIRSHALFFGNSYQVKLFNVEVGSEKLEKSCQLRFLKFLFYFFNIRKRFILK